MSEQWRGLHNPERHFSAFGTGTPLCDECDDALCVPSNPCYCCLEAEVEVLRAFVPESLRYPKRNGEFINIGPECFSDEEELVICWKGRNYYADPADEVNLIAEVEALRAQVQRVREVADDWDRLAALLTSHGVRHDLDVQHAAQRLDRALDGGAE